VHYKSDHGIIIEPIPWGGGDQELASMKLFNPFNWLIFLKFFLNGKKHTVAIHQKYNIDKVLCMWIVPCGLFGYWINKKLQKKYDVWALGADVRIIKKIPFFGKYWISKIVNNASGVFADGIKLADDVKTISRKDCQFLQSSRTLPEPEDNLNPLQPTEARHLLYVGRFHKIKGTDLLLDSLAQLTDETKKNIYVHVFGAGPLEYKLRTMCKQLNLESFVKIYGPIEPQDFSNYLEQASFLLIPSRSESIPIVFSDALQRGVPVITTPVGDLPELIQKFQCGILSQEVSVNSFTRALEEGARSDKKLYMNRAKTASEHFKAHRIAEKWLNL